MPKIDPWQPKLWCGVQDRREPTTRELARVLQEEVEEEKQPEDAADRERVAGESNS